MGSGSDQVLRHMQVERDAGLAQQVTGEPAVAAQGHATVCTLVCAWTVFPREWYNPESIPNT